MLGGILLFGWSATELMLFYWIEPLASILLKGYLNIYTPLQINPNETIKKKLWWWIIAFIVIIGLEGLSLYGIISFNSISPKPMPWTWDWLFLLVLIIVMYAMPIYAQKKQGFLPIEENMPLQTKILLSPIQFISTYVILGITLGGLFYNQVLWIWILFLVLAKMGIEIMLFFRLKNKRASAV